MAFIWHAKHSTRFLLKFSKYLVRNFRSKNEINEWVYCITLEMFYIRVFQCYVCLVTMVTADLAHHAWDFMSSCSLEKVCCLASLISIWKSHFLFLFSFLFFLFTLLRILPAAYFTVANLAPCRILVCFRILGRLINDHIFHLPFE